MRNDRRLLIRTYPRVYRRRHLSLGIPRADQSQDELVMPSTMYL